ncbi:MAG: hypothetical protein DI551_05155 [Micavibrio aeruginosavorus]|uniref:Colicin D immunity protein domain-containing protein n=1 Tax=Micavibrio aeruginosavorus TaxID=349221 RepID=A0A2W5N1W0_9BACT|nr:MAG: hypothetical protein DI551_05155 [Micavibrio aeruginosavorus]
MNIEYVQSFIELIEKFLAKSITALEFEKQFLTLWHKDERLLEAYNSVENLFFSVDQFTDLPLEPEDDPDDYINEDRLRESAAKTLEELRALK